MWVCVLVCALAGAAAADRPQASGVAPLSLRDAIAEALAASPVLGPAADSRDRAALDEDVAASAFALHVTPVLRAGVGSTRAGDAALGVDIAKRFPIGAQLVVSATAQQVSGPFASRVAGYSASLSQPLLRGFGGAPALARRLARRQAIAGERGLHTARQDLIVEVSAAYLDVLQVSRQAAAAERAVERARRLLVSSRARVKVGLATELDVSRAELLQAQSEVALLDSREALEGALDRVKSLLGRPLDATLTVIHGDLADPASLLDGFVPPLAAGGQTPEALTALALERRVDLREARDRIDDARRARALAKWNLLPDLSVYAAYSNQTFGPVASPLVLHDGGVWRVGVSTGYSLMRAEVSAAAAGAAISVRAAERAAADAERRVSEDVRRAHRAWVRGAAAIELQAGAVALAERQVRLAEIRASRGIAGNFDVIDAENSLFEAQTALIQAQASRALAGLLLRRAAGALDPEAYAR